ncbi:MAG: VanZ family protein, partial [bacterium]
IFTIMLALLIKKKTHNYSRKYGSIILFVLAIAILDEANQMNISGRTASLLDISLDMTGSIIALFIVHRFNLYRLNTINKRG